MPRKRNREAPRLTGSIWQNARPNRPSFEPFPFPQRMAPRRYERNQTLWLDCGAGAASGFLSRCWGAGYAGRAFRRAVAPAVRGVAPSRRRRGPAAISLTQDLVDGFGADMETVLREIGVGDLGIPKRVRALAASGAALLQSYAGGLAEGEAAACRGHRQGCRRYRRPPGLSLSHLAHYLREAWACCARKTLPACVRAR